MNTEQIKKGLHKLPHWTLEGNGKMIRRKATCKNFVDAVEIITQIKDIAEFENHHPDIHLTGYKNLSIELSTHSVGHLTESDFTVAEKIELILN